MGSCVDMIGVSLNPHPTNTSTEIKIRASTDTCFTDSENVRTITSSELTNCTNNFIRFNRLPEDRRHLQIYSTNDCCNEVLAFREITVLVPTDTDRRHGHLPISGDDTTLDLDGT